MPRRYGIGEIRMVLAITAEGQSVVEDYIAEVGRRNADFPKASRTKDKASATVTKEGRDVPSGNKCISA